MPQLCDFGLIGLAVMGENLALNVESRGYRVAVYNRTTSKVDAFIQGPAAGKKFVGCHSIAELVQSLAVPRKVMLLVKAGPAVDAIIEQLVPLLEPGDVIIDGGNTHFADTERRTRDVEKAGLLFVGSGVSGGEEGALKGPSLMPGGSADAWPIIRPIFQSIAAKVGPNSDIPCCEWVGPRGSGHYVKMVHNGIEYGDMQLICEAYFMSSSTPSVISNDELYEVFAGWNEGDLDSYLIEITRDIFTRQGQTMSGDHTWSTCILDRAGAKGTGKWMSQLALDLGRSQHAGHRSSFTPACLSAMKSDRVCVPARFWKARRRILYGGDRESFIDRRAAKPCTLRRSAATRKVTCSFAPRAEEHDWPLELRQHAPCCGVAAVSFARVFLDRIKEAFDADPQLENLLLAPYFCRSGASGPARLAARSSATAAEPGHSHAPAFTTALAYYGRPIVTPACRPTCCKRSGITLELTLSSVWTETAVSMPSGSNAAASHPLQHSPYEPT